MYELRKFACPAISNELGVKYILTLKIRKIITYISESKFNQIGLENLGLIGQNMIEI